MNHALSSTSYSRRGSLLAIIVAIHAGVIALIAVAKTVVPQIVEIPLIVEMMPAPPLEQKQPEAKPLPMSKPQTPRQKPAPAPQAPTPAIEATSSQQQAPSAPVAAPAEIKPAPPAPPVETVSQARFDADYLRNPAPPYPPLARRMGEEGKVILRVSVTPQGTADNVEIKTSSGSARLDEAAQKTVRNWKFVPAKRGEITIQSWVLVPIIFKLEQ